MNTDQNKVMDLRPAIERYVTDGCQISIGGFTLNRNPMAAVYEIMRQRVKNLHVCAHSNGQGVDELVGGGCVGKVEIAYAGTGRFAPTCIRFRKAVEEGTLLVEDYSNYQMTLRFMAGSMGLPFLPTRSGLETDIVNRWGFSRELRQEDPQMPNEKLIVMDNPFGAWGNAPKLVLVPAIITDVAIIHVQKADAQGTCRIKGLTFADVEQARAAKHLIVTCEELVESDELRQDPDQNQIPFFCVDAVCHVPYGAYPTACYRHYDYDPLYLNEFAKCAKDDSLYPGYLDKYIYGANTHQEVLDLVGKDRLEMIRADGRTGYAVGLDRR